MKGEVEEKRQNDTLKKYKIVKSQTNFQNKILFIFQNDFLFFP